MQTDQPTERDKKPSLAPHEQFAQDYADSIGRTLKEVVDAGMAVAPCACGAIGCRGWYITWPGVVDQLIHDVPVRTGVAS